MITTTIIIDNNNSDDNIDNFFKNPQINKRYAK